MNNNTKSLLKDLKTATEAEAFIKKYCKNKSERLFHSYLNQVVCEKHIDMSQVIKNSRISRNYVYNIINGKKRNPGRDKVLALCVAAHMTLEEVDQSLELCDHSRLNPYDERDVRIAVMINNKRFDVLAINLLLESKKLDPLDV